MKLFLLLTLLGLQVSAGGFSQNLNLDLKNAPLEKALSEIKKQSGFSFIYTREQVALANPVNCQLKNATVYQALAACFNNQPLTYVIEDNYVIIQDQPLTAATQPPITLRGKIVDENGNPLSGASILVKSTTRGATTNEKGEFEISAVEGNAVLLVSMVGHLSKEVAINGKSSITIMLLLEVAILDETVIKGYYNTSKRLNTGSVSKVSNAELVQQPVSNPLAALQGRVSGLFIVQGTGLPGSNFSVLLRGKNSIQNGNSPLYIIDGVPFLSDAERLTQFNGLNTASPFNTLNPDDIQSIEVLKDADATSIYGSRGANGVILITTKRGAPGRTTVDLRMYTGWGKISRSYDLMSTGEYVQMRKEAFGNDNIEPTNSNAYDILVWDTTRYTDWKKALIGNTAHSDNIQLRVSGGNTHTSFTLGANYYKETTVYPANDTYDNRMNVSLGLNHKTLNERFKISFNASVARDNAHLIQTDLMSYISTAPNAPYPYDEAGKLVFRENNFSFSNPYAAMLQTYETSTDRINLSSNWSYNLLPNLLASVNMGYSSVRTDEQSLYPIASQDPAYLPRGGNLSGFKGFNGWTIEPQIEYNLRISNKGKLQFLTGGTFQSSAGQSFNASAYGFTNDAQIKDLSAIPSSNIYITNANSDYRYTGWFGRANLNWDDKYLVNLTGRRDGSSRFGPDNRFANFGAAGLGWIFTKENFLRGGFLSFGKIRGSYGITGNENIGDYQYLDSWTSTYSYQGSSAIMPARLYNPYYSWELIRKSELGIELGMIKNRIFLTINAFSSISDNQLIRYNLPSQTGFQSILQNFPGKVQNRGLEFDIASQNLASAQFQWTSKLNLTIARNKLVSFPSLETSTYASDYVVGKPLSVKQGYRFLGVNAATGIYQFEDFNKDGMITPREGSNYNDYTVLGTTDPSYYGGLENEFKWKGWQLNFLFQFVKQMGRHAIYGNPTPSGLLSNSPKAVLDRWQKPGDEKPYQRYTQSYGEAFVAQTNASQSSAALVNASFVRLKSVALSYTFDASIIKKLRLQSARFFFEAQNLFTITPYKELDPENQSFGLLPPLRMNTIGIQVTL